MAAQLATWASAGRRHSPLSLSCREDERFFKATTIVHVATCMHADSRGKKEKKKWTDIAAGRAAVKAAAIISYFCGPGCSYH